MSLTMVFSVVPAAHADGKRRFMRRTIRFFAEYAFPAFAFPSAFRSPLDDSHQSALAGSHGRKSVRVAGHRRVGIVNDYLIASGRCIPSRSAVDNL